jgi:hypothetical protein
MKNFGSILLAYMIGWGVFFFYFVSVARRTTALRRDLQRMKESVEANLQRAKETVTRGK